MINLSEKMFSNSFVNGLVGDKSQLRDSRQVLNACYSLINPEPVKDTRLLAWSTELADVFNLSKPMDSSLDLQVLSGSHISSSMKPFAACYGGHQFGHWAGQLGDGRAITLGELTDHLGYTWEFQLKGSGRTPYSRSGDGRAVLRSSLREFLASEAMYYLGVPTTRALSLVSTGEEVVRDMFYDGHPKPEMGAITSRLAPCFVRFGNFEIQQSKNQIEILRNLVNWTITKYFKQIDPQSPDAPLSFFKEICKSTAKLMVEWERVGFVHGVMNTDNMSILGLSIDYGPFGWLDVFDPHWTPNTTDMSGRRYCFGNQASVAHWNLQKLAQALLPLLPSLPISTTSVNFEIGLEVFLQAYRESYIKMIVQRLGLVDLKSQEDFRFIEDLYRILQLAEVDWTIFFRSLVKIDPDVNVDKSVYYLQIKDAIYDEDPSSVFVHSMSEWLVQYAVLIRRGGQPQEQRIELMNKTNPKFIPRNYLLYQVIQDLDKGNSDSLSALYTVLKNPYGENQKFEYLAAKRPDWAKNTAGSSTLSCSS